MNEDKPKIEQDCCTKNYIKRDCNEMEKHSSEFNVGHIGKLSTRQKKQCMTKDITEHTEEWKRKTKKHRIISHIANNDGNKTFWKTKL